MTEARDDVGEELDGRARRDPPRPEDAMPEIVMMSEIYEGIDLDRPDPAERPTDPAIAGLARPTDGASGFAPTSPDDPAASVSPAPTTEPQSVQPVDPTTSARHGASAAATTVLDQMPAAQPVRDDPPPTARRHRSRGRRRRWPIVLMVLVLLVGACGVYYALTLWQVRSTGRADQARPVDAIVVMGAAQYDGTPSPQLAARLDHAVNLYGDGLAPLVIATGGNQPGDRFTEAEASANYLEARGVPDSAILLENSGSNTYESLVSVADMLAARELDDVLIVTDPYHALRSRMIADELGLNAFVSPTPSSVVTGWSSMRRRFGEAAGVAIGRLIGFERLSGLTS